MPWELAQALEVAERFDPQSRLLGGERKGELIPGFDLDNSPLAYGPERVQGRTVIFTTTNGTKALDCSRNAATILIGAFVNETALIERLKKTQSDVALVCAGTDGMLTAEDLLFAGSVLNRFSELATEDWMLGNVQAQVVSDYFQARGRDPVSFRETFLESLGALNLTRLGMSADIERAMERDIFDIVPIWSDAQQALIV